MVNSADKRKIIAGATLFLSIAAATFYALLRESSPAEILAALTETKLSYVLTGLVAVALFICGEAVNLGRCLSALGCQTGPVRWLHYAMTGFFFSAITPSSSGGQPMQLYVMHQDGISTVNGTLALMMELTGFQTAAILLGTWGLWQQHAFIFSLAGPMKYLIFAGFFVNLCLLLLLLTAIFSKTGIARLVGIVAALAPKLRFRSAAQFQRKALDWAADYRRCAICFKARPTLLFAVCATALLQMAALHSIPYWVYCSFGLTDFTLRQILSLQAVLFVAVSVIPLPGAVGVSESGFLVLFRSLFPTALLGSAMVVSRFISFYLAVIVCGLAVAVFALLRRKK